jgi:hypothetical protein
LDASWGSDEATFLNSHAVFGVGRMAGLDRTMESRSISRTIAVVEGDLDSTECIFRADETEAVLRASFG